MQRSVSDLVYYVNKKGVIKIGLIVCVFVKHTEIIIKVGLKGNKAFEKFSANLGNFCWAVLKISRVYGTKNLLGINKILKKAGKLIECIATGLRYLSVRRPKNKKHRVVKSQRPLPGR